MKYYGVSVFVCVVTCPVVFVCKLKSCQSSPRHPHSDSLPHVTPAEYQSVVSVWSPALWLYSQTHRQPHFFCTCHITCRQNSVSCCQTRIGGAWFLCIQQKKKKGDIHLSIPLVVIFISYINAVWHFSPGCCSFCQDPTDFSLYFN